MVDVLNDLNK